MSDLREPVYLEEKLAEIQDSGRLSHRSTSLPTWCPGCGYFSITEGVASALTRLEIPDNEVVIISGIGCASRFPFFMNTYGFHTLHGRTLPVATGIKMANDDLVVLAIGGDGDGFAIGGNHIPHAARRNVNITYLLFDNGIYGLTKGQTSPTTVVGFKTKTTPYENRDQPLNPLMMLLSYGTSWVG
jgi:2-oxoglutarate ferredoxin oxidoreductase subunit beta